MEKTYTCPSCAAEVKRQNMDSHMRWHQQPQNPVIVNAPAEP